MRLGFLFYRGLLRHPLRLVLIGLCAMICFTGQLGLSWAGESITATRQDFENTWDEDLIVYTEQTEPGTLGQTFGALPGVSAVSEGMLAEPIRCAFDDGAVRSVRFFAFVSGNTAPILDGEGPALSYGYRQDFDHLQAFTLPDGRTVSLDATAAMPMYTGVYVDRFSPSTDGDMVDVYLSAEQIREFTGECYVNYVMISLDGTIPAQQVLDSITGNDAVFVSYAAENEPAYEASLGLEAVVGRICGLFPWVMLAVGLVFVSIFLSGVARRSADSISILRTDGATLFAPFWGIYLYGLTAALVGFLCAIPAAMGLARFVVTTSLGNMGIPYAGLTMSARYPMLGLAGCLVLSLMATAVGMLAVSENRIARLRSRHTGRLTGRFLSIAITAVSTAVAVIMVLMSSLFMDSLDAVRREQFSDRYGYDVQLIYGDFVPVSRLQELESSGMVSRCEPMLLGTMTLINGEKSADVTCAGLSENPLLTLRNGQGQPMDIVENGILLSSHTAQTLGVAEGDLIQAKIRYGSTVITAMCCVSGISEQSTGYLEAVSIRTVEQYLNSSGMMNSVAVRVNPGKMEQFCAYARNLEDIHAVQTGQAAQNRFDSRYAGTRLLVRMIIVVAVALGFSVCLLMCYMQWKREIRRNTILHLLGQSPVRMLLRSGAWRLCGMVPGLVLGIAASVRWMPPLLSYLSTDSIRYPLALDRGTFLWSIGLCLIFELGCQMLYFLCCLRHWKCRQID